MVETTLPGPRLFGLPAGVQVRSVPPTLLTVAVSEGRITSGIESFVSCRIDRSLTLLTYAA